MPNQGNDVVQATLSEGSLSEGTLNDITNKFFLKLERKLNRNTTPYPPAVPSQSGRIYELGVIDVPLDLSSAGITVIPGDADVFNLGPIVSGRVNIQTISEGDRKRIIIRRILGYSKAVRMFYNPELIEPTLAPFIQEMIMCLEGQLGYKHTDPHYGTSYATFLRPGFGDSRFRDSEDYAGYELRLYSDTYPMTRSRT